MGSFAKRVKNYIEERYDAETASNYAKYLEFIVNHKLSTIENEDGFVTFKPEGDALIIYDMYIVPESRGQHKSWKLWNELEAKATALGKKVFITFSEKAGKNHNLGLQAMKAVNFVKMFDTNIDSVYIRGV